MRDISKAKITGEWATKPIVYLTRGTQKVPLCQTRKGKRGALYICFPVLLPGLSKETYDAAFATVLAAAYKLQLLHWRDARDLRLSQLTFWTKGIGDLLESGQVDQSVAEKVLDFLYAHMGERLKL